MNEPTEPERRMLPADLRRQIVAQIEGTLTVEGYEVPYLTDDWKIEGVLCVAPSTDKRAKKKANNGLEKVCSSMFKIILEAVFP